MVTTVIILVSKLLFPIWRISQETFVAYFQRVLNVCQFDLQSHQPLGLWCCTLVDESTSRVRAETETQHSVISTIKRKKLETFQGNLISVTICRFSFKASERKKSMNWNNWPKRCDQNLAKVLTIKKILFSIFCSVFFSIAGTGLGSSLKPAAIVGLILDGKRSQNYSGSITEKARKHLAKPAKAQSKEQK